MTAMSEIRKPRLKAAGKNDPWFALFFILAVVVAGLIPHDRTDDTSSRPAPVPAEAALKDQAQ